METINKLLNKSYYIIDYLPMQVPKDSEGQFFEVEAYLLSNMERYGIQDRFVGIILKAMCYYHTSVLIKDKWTEQPSPDMTVAIIERIKKSFRYHESTVPRKRCASCGGWRLHKHDDL